MDTKTKLWSSDFVVNAVANFFIYLVYYFLIVVMASYATERLRATHSQAGLATGLFILGALLARIVAGRAVGRLGEKRTLFIGLAVYFITTFLYFPVSGLTGLYAVRFLHGIGFGISATGAGTIAARIIPPERRGEGVSYFALTTTLASAIGPLAGIYLSQRGDLNLILAVSAALLLGCFATAVRIRVPARKPLPAEETSTSARRRRGAFSPAAYFEATAVPISFICALVVIGYSGVLAFLASYAKESDLMQAGKAFFLVYSLFVLVSRPITGRLFDRKGENFIVYPAIFIFAIGLVLLAAAHDGALLLCSAAVIGFGYGTFFSCANAIALKVSRQDRIHLSTSTYFIFADLGAGLGPFLLGFAIPLLGFRGLYLVLSGFVLCCVVFYYLAHGAKAARVEA